METEEQKPKTSDLEAKLRGLMASGVLAEQDVADALSQWVYKALAKEAGDAHDEVPPLIEAGILAAVGEACRESSEAGRRMGLRNRVAVRIGAALGIVGVLFDGDVERVDELWDEANAWKEPADG